MEKYGTFAPAETLQYNPDSKLRYLRAFWDYMTEDMTLKQLREINFEVERQTNEEPPQEYSI